MRMRRVVLGFLAFSLVACVGINSNVSKAEKEIKKQYLGELVNAGNNDGFAEKNKIDEDDPHYGWDLGKFYVDGFTQMVHDEDGNPVFLKNVGDEVTLWFNLVQDIDKLNDNEDLTISEEKKGYDEDFGIEKSDFGRGTLIVRFTDYQNKVHDPVIYRDYLSAKKKGANTKVELCEEGDYEVALDYEVEDHITILPNSFNEYKIFTKFSVRNGNCMVYPKDVKTKGELINTSFTPNGFYIDLAKSRYLKPIVKKETLAEGASGLTEDTRYNRPAADGEEFTEEGIYTITVENPSTHEKTSKKIYVGDDDVLKAYVTTGLSISEIKNQISHGATVDPNGALSTVVIPETESDVIDDTTVEDVENDRVDEAASATLLNTPLFWIGIGAGVIVIAIIFVVLKTRKKKNKQNRVQDGDTLEAKDSDDVGGRI